MGWRVLSVRGARRLSVSMAAAIVLSGRVFADWMPAPASASIAGDGFTNLLSCAGNVWSGNGVTVTLADDGWVSVSAPQKALSWLQLDWRQRWPSGTRCLADTWERAYGDLEWREIGTGERISPWYFLLNADGRTDGYGVAVQPNALACWKVSSAGYSLKLDLRAGGVPVRLGGRTLRAVRIVRRKGVRGESAFQAGRAFCRLMCPVPRLPKEPFYGYNDWYCAYGRNTATNFLLDAAFVSDCAKGLANRPYVVLDDGWQRNSPPVVKVDSGYGPWDSEGPKFGMDMRTFCGRVAAMGARPGIWYRPFRAWSELPAEWTLKDDPRYLDPTVPAVRQRILSDVRRFRDWGFRLVKIDYLTYDICRVWGRAMGDVCIPDGTTNWRDCSRTTCEVMKDLYGAMREAAGDDVIIIGCNALNHLAAGLFELQRIGDDTSGREWNRTRDMGINAIGMRSIQDRTFFVVDADCCGLAARGAVPWDKNSQWLDLLARSGTALFVSWHRDLADTGFRAALSRAFRTAAVGAETGEPLDWLDAKHPAHWRFADGEASYVW